MLSFEGRNFLSDYKVIYVHCGTKFRKGINSKKVKKLPTIPLTLASHKQNEIFNLVFKCFLTDSFDVHTALSQKNYVDSWST